MALTNKVLLIGWDAADWKVITPLVDAGKMPNLQQFLSEGVMGNLATLYPALSPMLWTSIATGKRPYKHGIHGFIEPDPQTGNVRPITNLSRKTKAIWNILNQEGKRCNVVNWWPSHPAEPINGVMVSNHFAESINSSPDQAWPMAAGTIHPLRLRKPLRELRVHPLEIEGEQLLPFIPLAAEIDQDQDKRLYSVAKILAECASVHAVATGLMQLEPWDFMAVYYDAIDHFGHGFMKYHPPKSPWISDRDFELYKDVIEGAYRFHDLMLGVMMALAGQDTTMIIVSDHGFHPDRLRPQYLPNEPAGPAAEHRPFGIFAMKGPGVKRDEVIFGASLLDITPTILTALGLPVGKDMDGRPLVASFTNTPTVNYIESWDQVAGDAGTHPPNLQIDAVDSQEAIQHLVELGYVEALDDDQQQRVAESKRELRYNLARSYVSANLYLDAIEILEELWANWPEESRFGVQLFNCFLALNKTLEAEEVLNIIIEHKQNYALKAKTDLEELLTTLQAKTPEEISEQDQYRLRKLRAKASTNLTTIAYLQGSLLQAQGRYQEAVQALEQAKTAQTHNLPSLYLRIAEVYLSEKRWLQADTHFLQVLELDPVNPQAHLGLCRSYLKQKRNEAAITQAMAAIGLIYHNPQAHFLCGVALQRCGQLQDAIKAFKTAISQNPAYPMAYSRLAWIYRHNLKDAEQATKYQQLARESRRQLRDFKEGKVAITEMNLILEDWEENVNQINPVVDTAIEETVVIVSGLPRSGTSMMMQMLAAGGFPVVTDEVRTADDSNPRGYYEFEKAKQLGRDNQWLKDIQGQAVKIVAQLLPNLAPKQSYRIIFMQRYLPDILASQREMLQKLGRQGSNLSEQKLARIFIQQLTQVKHQLNQCPDVNVLYVNYEDVLANPQAVAAQVNEFLGGNLNEATMTAAVAPQLRHQHQKQPQIKVSQKY
jgi:predicted AlkP superfamily phosphohydrolase/phosphomutase/tetratricopeptide (TPR) repeat protein